MATKKRVLILAANPKDTDRLHFDKEIREIKAALQRAKYRERFAIEQCEAVQVKDLRRALIDYKPHIVHFTGHGEGDGILLEDEDGSSEPVQSKALASLFKLSSDHVECVLLNACYSEAQAKAINKHIPYVIGMKREIGDGAAIEFAIGFYDALFAGETYQQAFDYGKNAIQLKSIPEHLTPVFNFNSVLIDKTQPTKTESKKMNPVRIFISYKRDIDPDEPVALQVAKALKDHGHYVFIDQVMPAGEEW
ncbi:MAG TPA: CHAT domain-containing protein, partial [bacterium]